MTTAYSDELFEALTYPAINSRLKESLDRVKAACDFLAASSAKVTLTAVGRYCSERWGGPKPQSIRNAKETLFAYVTARQAEQTLPEPTKKGSYAPLIHDENIRAYVELLRIERDEAIRAKERVIGGLRSIPGIPIDDLLARGFKGAKALPAPTPAIPAKVRIALTHLFDAERLTAVGLENYKSRLRSSVTGHLLLDKTDVDALLAMLDGAPQEIASSTEFAPEETSS